MHISIPINALNPNYHLICSRSAIFLNESNDVPIPGETSGSREVHMKTREPTKLPGFRSVEAHLRRFVTGIGVSLFWKSENKGEKGFGAPTTKDLMGARLCFVRLNIWLPGNLPSYKTGHHTQIHPLLNVQDSSYALQRKNTLVVRQMCQAKLLTKAFSYPFRASVQKDTDTKRRCTQITKN